MADTFETEYVIRDEESVFARDDNGQLIRAEKATETDYQTEIKLTIDGSEIVVRKAVPEKDSQGNVIFVDASGTTKPRPTTIYDAALKLAGELAAAARSLSSPAKLAAALNLGQYKESLEQLAGLEKELTAAQNATPEKIADARRKKMAAEASHFVTDMRNALEKVPDAIRKDSAALRQDPEFNRAISILGKLTDVRSFMHIPVVCHAEHLEPAGVCRVCCVEVFKAGERGGKKLQPACFQPVDKNMEVNTLNSDQPESAKRVRQNVKVVLELLAADHLPPEKRKSSELADLIAKLNGVNDVADPLPETLPPTSIGIRLDRFTIAQRPKYTPDLSSQLINVDHDMCVLCDRCVRACTDIKENFVIGRSGKGYTTRIGFDLNDPMGTSSCVECGECMLHCPTTALTFRKPIDSEWHAEQIEKGCQTVTPKEMDDDRLLRCLPPRYRFWNQSSVVRRQVKKGERLCTLGEYGSTAFILRRGKYGICIKGDPEAGKVSSRPMGWVERLTAGVVKQNTELEFVKVAVPEDVILGEMTCLTFQRRTATIIALEDGEILELRRNMLYALQRTPESRDLLDNVYKERALRTHLEKVPFFEELDAKEREFVRDYLLQSDPARPGSKDSKPVPRLRLFRLQPGQTIFPQGEVVRPGSCFFMIRVGHVKVSQTVGGEERIINYQGPDTNFGELALLAYKPEVKKGEQPDPGDEVLGKLIPPTITDRRTATCTALDDVELVAIERDTFRNLVKAVPKLLERVRKDVEKMLNRSRDSNIPRPLYEDFTQQGLYNAQKLLVLDLEACTRCDECVKACADVHGGVTRFIRDGLRFDKWLVASACRSCTDPYCLVGCPVDAIHRVGGRLEIQIESHCIGCGQCATNCPYGNINMHTTERPERDGTGPVVAVTRSKATMCDLCHDVVGPKQEVSCVFACPHNAAFRMSGDKLLEIVAAGR